MHREKKTSVFLRKKQKKGEEGTGLGLSICKRIIENNHQGKINHKSIVGEWTSFYIYLPLDVK